MKAITVSDEVYDFLKSCQTELLTQNNRHTANPIFGFQIEKEVASVNENQCYFLNADHDGTITNSNKPDYISDLAEYILEYNNWDMNIINKKLEDNFEDIIEYKNQNEYNTEDDWDIYLKNLLITYLETKSYFGENLLRDCFDIDCFWYEKIPVMYEESISLFESDMQAHLNMNRHNMPESTRTYVYSNHRTPKMTQLRDVLMKEIKFEE